MFSKFSPASGRVLRAAEQECRNHNHYYIGVEHLTVALLEERDDAIAQWFERQRVDQGEVHSEIRRALGTGDDRLWEGILVTPRLRTVVALATDRCGDRLIEPFDLFQAIMDEGGSFAAHILRNAECTP